MMFSDPLMAGTGFSEEARNISYRLAQAGHEIFYINNSIQFPIDLPDSIFPDLPQKGAKIKVLGNFGSQENFGAEAAERYYSIYHPDLMFVFGDPHHIEPYLKLKKKCNLPLLHYTTLDGLPIYSDWKRLFDATDINVTITEWAMNEYRKQNFNISAYIHHGINWQYFQTNNQTKQQLKQKYNLDGYTIFINWDVNQYRKRTDALLRCWKDFNPLAKKAKLLLFTDFNCPIGWNLEAKIYEYGIPRETIISPYELIGRDKLWGCAEEPWLIKEIGQLGDIYLSTTGGEGFGKALLEAMTLQLPVIATDYSAIPEVLDKYGVLIPCYEGRAGRYQMHDAARHTELGVVNEEKFTEAMLYYFDHPAERNELGAKANEWARMFDYDRQIMVGWNQLLDQVNPDTMMANSLLRS